MVEKGTELRGVLLITWYVGQIKEGVGVSDVLFRNQYIVLVVYVHE
jgi:hypothetical protein